MTRHSQIVFIAGISLTGVLCLGAFAQSSDKRVETLDIPGAYRPCIEPPKFERPNFLKAEFQRQLHERPEIEKRSPYRGEFIRPEFVRPEFVRAQIERPMFMGCPKYRVVPIGYQAVPVRLTATEGSTNSVAEIDAQVAAAAVRSKTVSFYHYAPPPPADDGCCGGTVKTAPPTQEPAETDRTQKIN